MKSLIKKSIARLPLAPRLGIVSLASQARLDRVLPIPRAAHSVVSPQFRKWIKEHVSRETPFFAERYDMHAYLCGLLGNQSLAYYEFGVHEGRSLRWWTEFNNQPGSRFYGFDSFAGLPEDWDPNNPKGTFDLKGDIPVFDDKRVILVKGWFDDTLPSNRCLFETPLTKVLHMDADLYSSTMTVFENVGRVIDEKTIVIFDEFSDVDHEFKALADYGRPYKVIAATSFFVQVAVRFTA